MDAPSSIGSALHPLRDAMRERAEVVEPGDSYWFHRPQRRFPPPSVRDPDAYDGGDRLSLTVTQTDLPAARQRDLVRRWCHLLPTLTGVRTLWFHTKVTQELFEAACGMPGLAGLYIKWSSITSLAPVAGLQALSHFHLGGAPSARDITALASLPRLVDLELRKVAAAADLDFVQGLPGLRALQLAGDTHGGKALKLASLAPLAALVNLEKLQLFALQVEDGSLDALAMLPALRYLDLSNQFPMEAVARLAGQRPDLACTSFAPVTGPHTAFACKTCGQRHILQLTGKGKPWLCSDCDAARVAEHIARFEAIVRAQRALP
ncbi:hypothetical protein [Arenimonas sp. MALMAid1274]|uniref:hypothetical protein n=1 Tax=Arenimonas sp. MALMAid1274 TaxID=3411630 RepID=UPI003B9ECEB7